MNRDMMMVMLGVGVGTLISTEQGRNIIGSLSRTPAMQALGEGVVNLFTGKGIESAAHNTDAKDTQQPGQTPETARINTQEQGA